MANGIRIADTSEIAFYRDGTTLHVGLVTGHNNGTDEAGRNHKNEYDARRAAGEHPHQHYADVAMHPVTSYTREDGAIVKAHWRTNAGDVDRLVISAESDFHKMAKQACYELLRDGKFNQMVKTGIKHFVFGSCAQEHPVRIGKDIFYADVGVWDLRFPGDPIAFEITYTSANSARKIDAFRENDTVLYSIKIYEATREEIKNGNLIDVQFYKDMMLRKRFHRLGVPNKSRLEVEYIRIQEAIDAAEFERRQASARAARDKRTVDHVRPEWVAPDVTHKVAVSKSAWEVMEERRAPKPTRMLFCGICRAWETPEYRCQHIAQIIEEMPWTVEFHTIG